MSDQTPNKAKTPQQDPERLPEEELQQRIVYALLGPAVSMAASFGVSQKVLQNWVQVAYFEHLRSKGVTLKEAGAAMGVSERTAKRLSREFKTHFLQPELEHNLPVRIEFMLRAEPMSAARLSQVLRQVPPATLAKALEQLEGEGRIVAKPGRTVTYRVAQSISSLVRDTWIARIGGVNSLLGNLTDTIKGRFFDNDPNSFARTMTFHLRPERRAELEAAFGELVKVVAALDNDAEGKPGSLPVRLSIFWSPKNDP